ncbi:MAG: hypothetical protein V5A39_13425 [Haloarculaceae archaeon]
MTGDRVTAGRWHARFPGVSLVTPPEIQHPTNGWVAVWAGPLAGATRQGRGYL